MLASMRRITVYWSSGARQGPAASLRFVDGVDGINRGLQFPSSTIQRAGIESGIVDVGPFSPFPMRTKMRLKLLAAGRPTAISPAGFESPKARPPATRSHPLSQPKCVQTRKAQVFKLSDSRSSLSLKPDTVWRQAPKDAIPGGKETKQSQFSAPATGLPANAKPP
jgi:hypothetical protein